MCGWSGRVGFYLVLPFADTTEQKFFHTVSLMCYSIWVDIFQNVITLNGVHLMQVELS